MSHRILLVDDEVDILEFVRYNLVREGYEVFTAETSPIIAINSGMAKIRWVSTLSICILRRCSLLSFAFTTHSPQTFSMKL